MKIKFTASVATERRAYGPGDAAEWPDADAARLVAAGFAEPAEPPPDAGPPRPKK